MLRVVGRNLQADRRSLLLGITLEEVLYLTAHPGEVMLVDYTDMGAEIEIALTIAVSQDGLEETKDLLELEENKEATKQ